MLEDETCWFLAADFDKGEWQRDVAAFVETCKTKEIPFAVERSRSGGGAHVWFFFENPVGRVGQPHVNMVIAFAGKGLGQIFSRGMYM